MNDLGRFVNQPKPQFHQHLTPLATSPSNSTPTPFLKVVEEEHGERLVSSMVSSRSLSLFLPEGLKSRNPWIRILAVS